MGNIQFVDISSWQSDSINWPAYKAWSAAGDGIARISLRSSEGTGVIDPAYYAFRSEAEANGIQIIHYHYAYPQYNSPEAEADYQHAIVGTVGPHDLLMLDYEEMTLHATADWAYRWLVRQEANYGGRLPTIYASDAYIRARLQDTRLARYPLTLANWQYTPDERPACPPPWTSYAFLQYSDRATIPGIPGPVDANIYLGGLTENMLEIDLTDPWVAAHFEQTETNPTRWQCTKNNYSLFAGILAVWRKMNGAPRLPISPETKCGTQTVYQECESGIVLWDPANEIDGVSGPWAPGYLLKLSDPLAQKLLASAQPPQPTMPNIADALAQVGAITTAAQAIGTALAKLESDLKQ